MGILQDLRLAYRTLIVRNRALTLACTVTLALGIGAATAIYSVIDSVLLQPLPYPEPHRLVRVMETGARAEDGESPFLSGLSFRDLREGVRSFQGLAGFYDYSPEGFDLSLEGRPQRIVRLKVTSGYFETLGTAPLLGRTFRVEDEAVADIHTPDRGNPAQRLIVLSHGLWQRAWAGRADIVGQDILLSGESYTVLGIMPESFRDPLVEGVDVWAPLDLSPGGYNTYGNRYVSAIGRLAPGSTVESAQAELRGLDDSLRDRHPANRDRNHVIRPLQQHLTSEIDATLYVLLAATGLLLLTACVNAANLFLARGTARRTELAVRAALGSSRLRLARQMLAESLVTSFLGAGAGLLIAWAGVAALMALRPQGLPSVAEVGFQTGTFTFAALAGVLTAVLFGLAPAFKHSRFDLESALRQGGRSPGSGVPGQRLRGFLVASQVALALVLLIGAGLLFKSFFNLLQTDLGFRSEKVLTYRVDLPLSAYPNGELRDSFYARLHQRLGALPGVVAAGSTSKLPSTGRYHSWGFSIPGRPQGENRAVSEIRCVDGDYFQALGIHLQQGRLFDERDGPAALPVIVVNRQLARRIWPDRSEDQITGGQLRVAGELRTVIGVVSSVRSQQLSPAGTKIYLPHSQFGDDRNWSLTQVAAVRTPDPGLISLIRREVAAIDPRLSVFKASWMDEVVAQGVSSQRFAAALMSVFALIALTLAAVGIYGALSYSVSLRRREIGIRIALGADQRSVRQMVARQALALAALGIAAGLAISLGATRWLASLVHDVSLRDPVVFAGVAGALALIALLASAVPAQRAARVKPNQALRQD